MRLVGLVAEASLTDLGLLETVIGDPATEVLALTMDSRQVAPGSLFACVPGDHRDGHDFAAAAVAGGAAAVLCERPLDLDVPQVVVTSVRRALGPVADAIHGHPSRHLTVAGVTGTNGKTTTCALFCKGRSRRVAGGRPPSVRSPSQRTTPEAPDLHGSDGQMARRRRGRRRHGSLVPRPRAAPGRRRAASRRRSSPTSAPNTSTTTTPWTTTSRPRPPCSPPTGWAWPWSTGPTRGGAGLLERLAREGVPTETFAPDDATDVELAPSRQSLHLGRPEGRDQRGRAGSTWPTRWRPRSCARALGVPPGRHRRRDGRGGRRAGPFRAGGRRSAFHGAGRLRPHAGRTDSGPPRGSGSSPRAASWSSSEPAATATTTSAH